MRKSTGSQVLDKAQDLYLNSKELARDGATHAKSFIHESPVLSTFLGLGAGFLIGMWLNRGD